MKHIRNKTVLAIAATAVLLLWGCTKDIALPEGGNAPQGEFVSVTLPFAVTDVEPATATTLGATAATTRAATSEGFTVSFGKQTTDAATAAKTTAAPDSPDSRTVARALNNVWVLQFDASGKNISTTNTGTLAAGAHLTPTLKVGTGHTIYVVANGPASGLSTSTPATLAAFESEILYTTIVSAASPLPLSGKLTGVTVVNLGDGKGAVRQLSDVSAAIILRRIHTEVTLAVDFGVTDYTLTGAELYNVPKGATYGWDDDTTTFPDNSIAANFVYTSTSGTGKPSQTPTTDGTKKIFKWFIGDNRRGDVAGLDAMSHRHSAKAPAYATFARVTLTSTSLSTQKIFYDIYLGSGAVTNFDIKRNHTYTVTATIKGSAAYQELLTDTDARVSGVDIPITLTDKRVDSPFLISPKSIESTTMMIWGPETSIPGARDVFNGKANTDVIMALSTASQYSATQYCRQLGAQYYLPAQAELMLMWIYRDAIPAAERLDPTRISFWSSTEYSVTDSEASLVSFSEGVVSYGKKTRNDYYNVRCVKDL